MADDAELLRAWRLGDQSSGKALFERHFDAIYRFFYNKTESTRIDDLVQETFAACLSSRNPSRQPGNFRAYLLGIARHKLLDQYRRNHREDTQDLTAHDIGVAPIDAAERNQERRALLRSLRRIPLESQILLELSYWEGLTDRELAELYGCPLGTTKSRIRKARLQLRSAIAQTLRSSQFESSVDTIEGWLDSMARFDPRGPRPAS